MNQANPNLRWPGGGIDSGFTLLPETLKKGGYECHFLGKWHAGLVDENFVPTKRGFDSWLGFFGGSEDHFTQVRSEGKAGSRRDLWMDVNGDGGGPARKLAGTAFTDDLFANRFDDLCSQLEKPLFLYYAYQCVHDPLQAPKALLRKYAAKILSPAKQKNYRKDAVETKVEQRKIDAALSAKASRRRLTYMAMVSYVDESVARVEKTLKANGLWDNTFLLFLSDNGGASATDADSSTNYPLRGGKYSDFEGGVRTVAFATGGYLPRQQRGRRFDDLVNHRVSIADWYATFLDMATIKEEDTKAAKAGLPPMDSVSVLPLILGNSNAPVLRQELVLTAGDIPESDIMPGSRGALLSGKFKLLFGNQKPAVFPVTQYPKQGVTLEPLVVDCGDAQRREGCLFDLEADPQERTDIAKLRPDVTRNLTQRYIHLAKFAYQTPRLRISYDLRKMKDLYATMDKRCGGFWCPYTNLSATDLIRKDLKQPYFAFFMEEEVEKKKTPR